MKPFRQSELPLYPFHKSASEDRIALQLRFRHDCISVLLDAHGEIAVLDKKMAAVLRLLKETVTGTILKVFLGNGRGRDDRDSAGKRSTLGLPLEIEVHGLDKDYSKIGSTLSNASMYLQEPVILDQGVTYRNPHFLSWDENGVTPQLNTSGRDIETDFETAIEAILESPNPVLVAPDLEQDARISTQLRRLLNLIYLQNEANADLRHRKPPAERPKVHAHSRRRKTACFNTMETTSCQQ